MHSTKHWWLNVICVQQVLLADRSCALWLLQLRARLKSNEPLRCCVVLFTDSLLNYNDVIQRHYNAIIND